MAPTEPDRPTIRLVIDVPAGRLYLGEAIGPDHERTGEPTLVKAADLTTHGVIVGMTGSGKTGLGVALIEEALLQRIPTLILDPKGDLGNLLLAFPDLAAESFAPWVDGGDAAQVAAAWTEGLASWGIDGTRIQALRDAAAFTIYTPGSASGVGLNVVGSLQRPAEGTDAETITDEVGGFVSGLLGLVGIEADPLASREHILLANLVQQAWANGQDLDLAGLVAQVQTPPLRKLGVFELDEFFPPDDRTKLALRLNGLLASPAFAAWGQGETLDIGALLEPGGRPGCAIISLSHLSDEERQFVVTLVLSKLVTWMRRQPGTDQLRALVYFDEVVGYVPPTAAPPAKGPILTLLKQARAFGVGLVLATQNPVDVDYKALSNAGTWMIGRLQTEQDKARLLDGLSAAAGGVDTAAMSSTIAGLDKREFVLRQAGKDAPVTFTSRWAMSYLRGPLTREQIATLMADRRATPGGTAAGGDATTTPAPGPADASTPTTPAAGAPADAPAAPPAAPPATSPEARPAAATPPAGDSTGSDAGEPPAPTGDAPAVDGPAVDATAATPPAVSGAAPAGVDQVTTGPPAVGGPSDPATSATAPTPGAPAEGSGSTPPSAGTTAGADAAGAPTPGQAEAPVSTGSAAGPEATPSTSPTGPASPGAPSDADTTPVMPSVAEGVAVRWLDPAAPWAGQVGAVPTSTRFAASVVVKVDLLFDDTKADLRHTEEVECVLHPLADPPDAASLLPVDHDPRDLLPAAPAGATYVLPDAKLSTKGLFTAVQKGIVDHLLATRTVTLFANRDLKLVSRPGETQEAFTARCDAAADAAADQQAAALAKRFQAKIERARTAVATAEDRAEQAKAAQSTKKTDELMSGAGDLLGAVFGGRGSARSIARKVGSLATRRSRSSEASKRVEAAGNRVEEKQQALADLEADMADELATLGADWDAKALAIEPLDVPLERTDVQVRELALVWIPV